ncbi:hypothetical protein OESDEN_01703 [Oesophagostomum dentatum]|uniref:Serine carboxypeptidase S28 n=1 Tax=Oesophagostomum dentatum TaxID=61180 RepID=A0A0B1TSC8_OESDE|nr:hypothetical protein OESDEN_01703 [Oesophagostomum dentatum]
MYGGIHNYKGTNVAITTSTNDPWRTLSNISLNPNVTTVVINGGYHCADMFTDASANVKQAQAKIMQFVKKLLNIE